MTTKTYYKNPQFNLRISQDLKDAVAKSAKESGRSINAEINYRLQKSLKNEYQVSQITDSLSDMDSSGKTKDEFIDFLLNMLQTYKNNDKQ